MKYLVSFLLAIAFLPGIAKADMIPDNSHTINNCISVENINDYPDYDFVWTTNYRTNGSYKITNTDPICNTAGTYTLLAIQKTDWTKVQYPQEDPQSPESNLSASWAQDPRNHSLFISSNYSISLSRDVPDTNSAVKQSVTVHVDDIGKSGVAAHTATTVTSDKDGVDTQQTNTSTPTKIIDAEPEEDESLSPIAIGLIGLGILGLAFAAYSWKKK